MQSFLHHYSTNERAGILDAKGQLNDVGVDRMVNALFASVYPGDAGIAMLNRFKESIDPGVDQPKKRPDGQPFFDGETGERYKVG